MSPLQAMPVLLLLLLVAGGAWAASTDDIPVPSPLPADALPVPPPKPGQSQILQGFAPAPVPDPDLQRPRADVMADNPRTKLVPNLFSQPDRRSGDGYVKGSAGEYNSNHRMRPSPGINLRVMLQ